MNKKTLNPFNFVLSVIDPNCSNNICIEEAVKDKNLFENAIKFAEKNGLLYLFIYNLKNKNISLPHLVDTRWNLEEDKLKRTLTFLNDFSCTFGFEYIIIKACPTMPHIPRDVDIFINSENAQEFLRLFEKFGMKYAQKSDGEISFIKEGLLKIDIYRRICYFGIDFFDSKSLWNSIRKNKIFDIECPCLEIEIEFMLSLIHSIFGHGRISLLDFLHLRYLRKSINVYFCREYASRNGWGSVFDLILNEFDSINNSVYVEHKILSFPYLVDLNFIKRCVLIASEYRFNKFDEIIILTCLIFERIIELNKDSHIYNFCKSFEPTRKLANNSLSLFRTMRGDEKK